MADNRITFPTCYEFWSDWASYGNNLAIVFNPDIMETCGITEDMVKTESGLYHTLDIVANLWQHLLVTSLVRMV